MKIFVDFCLFTHKQSDKRIFLFVLSIYYWHNLIQTRSVQRMQIKNVPVVELVLFSPEKISLRNHCRRFFLLQFRFFYSWIHNIYWRITFQVIEFYAFSHVIFSRNKMKSWYLVEFFMKFQEKKKNNAKYGANMNFK